MAAIAAVAALTAPLWFGAQRVDAHEPGTTGVTLTVDEEFVVARFDLPLEPLEAALDATVPTDAVLLSQQRDLVIDYVSDHLEVSTDGDVWSETFGRLTAITVGGVESLRVDATLEPGAAAAAAGEFTFAYDGLIEHDSSQQVFVTTMGQDGAVTLTGVLDSDTAELSIGGEGDGATGSTLGTMIGEGFEHVLDGADHMMFLLVLLIPAPLAAVGRRWTRSDGTGWHAIRKVAKVATAFAVGHSLTLAASTLGWLSMPTRTIEVLIGVSVAVSAIHAIRPLVSHGEMIIAGGFGLVHGLAFAGIIDDLGLRSTSLGALFGFNLGIEIAQLAIVGLTFPSLLIMSRRSAYRPIRLTSASIALAAATGWIVERLDVAESPLRPIETAVVDHLVWVVAALAVGAIAAVAVPLSKRSTASMAGV